MSDAAHLIRVLIADDHQLFRDGLRMLLEAEPSFRVVGQASDGREAVDLARTSKPDVLLLDLHMPRCTGMEALSLLQQSSLSVHTLILATEVDESQMLEALRRGASGILLKESATLLLHKSIRSIVAEECWIGRKQVSELVQELKKHPATTGKDTSKENWHLTAREAQIIEGIVAGSTNKDIAQQLQLSEQTVKHHLTHIFDKTGVSNRLELALFAIHYRITSKD
jgi:two-component system nitrate/nitrite response regulator NarL